MGIGNMRTGFGGYGQVRSPVQTFVASGSIFDKATGITASGSTGALPKVPLTDDERTEVIVERDRLLNQVVPESEEQAEQARRAANMTYQRRQQLWSEREQARAELNAHKVRGGFNYQSDLVEELRLQARVNELSGYIQDAARMIRELQAQAADAENRAARARQRAQRINKLLDDDRDYQQQSFVQQQSESEEQAQQREALIQAVTAEVAANPEAVVQRAYFGDLRESPHRALYLRIAEDLQPGVTDKVLLSAREGMTPEQYDVLVKEAQADLDKLTCQVSRLAKRNQQLVRNVAVGAAVVGAAYFLFRGR